MAKPKTGRRMRCVVSPDGRVWRSASAAATAYGLHNYTVIKRCRAGRDGWRFAPRDDTALAAPRRRIRRPSGSIETEPTHGAIIAPTTILIHRPLDPSDGRYWI